MREIVRKAAFVCVLLVVAGAFGCGASGTKVLIRQDVYTPSFPTENLAGYKGKEVYLTVTNNANNTSIWNYYNPGNKTYYYEALPALQTYFWDCFLKGFHRIGVKPAADGAVAPTMQVILNSVTDQEVKFQVTAWRAGTPMYQFQKDFVVTMPPTQETDPAQLEKRSYQMVDSAFLAIVGDADFQKAFLSK